MCDAVVAEDRGVAQVAYATGVVDLFKCVLSAVGEDQQRRALMIGVGLKCRELVGDDRVGDALDALTGESETPGDHRDAEPAGRSDPHHLPARLRLPRRPSSRLAL